MKHSRAVVRLAVLGGVTAFIASGAFRIAHTPLDLSTTATRSSPLDLRAPSTAEPQPLSPVTDAEILARPIFASSRRPYVPPPPDVPPDAAPAETDLPSALAPEEYSLAGVFIHDGERKALLVSPTDPEGQWFATGAELGGGRKLVSVAPTAVEIGTSTESTTLQLYVDSPPVR